jgi:hypothetical protein
VSVQLLVAGSVVGGGLLAPALAPEWEIAGSGDFDSDGRDDVVLRNLQARELEIWFLNGPQIVQRASLRCPFSSKWQLVGVADFDGDAVADMLWFHAEKRRVAVSLVGERASIRANPGLFRLSLDVDVVAAGDADGNRLPDVVVRRRVNGALEIWLTQLRKGKPQAPTSLVLDHEAFLSGGAAGVLAGYEVQGGGDYDGDDRLDLLLRNPQSGDLRVWYLDDGSVRDEVRITDPGPTWVFEGVGPESPSTHR